MAPKKNAPIKKNDRWVKLLLISGGLNVALCSLLAYTWVMERPPLPYCVLKPASTTMNSMNSVSLANGEVLQSFKEMPLDQLIAKLSNRQPVENGILQRDIALGCLNDFHHFNLSSALLGMRPPQKTLTLRFGQDEKVTIFSDMTEGQFEAILHYVRREQWPFSSEGLFSKLQASEYQHEASLQEAFSLTPEFQAVETLFSRARLPTSKRELIAVLKEGNWKMLHTFTEQQKMSQDLSDERRLRFLQDYIAHQSSSAALLLLQHDYDFAVKSVDDQTAIALLKALTVKTAEAEKYALDMLSSSRDDGVWQQASLRLFEFAGMTPPSNQSKTEALSIFLPKPIAIKKSTTSLAKTEPPKVTSIKVIPQKKAITATPKPEKKDLVYVVQSGDSLWKISKRFKVDVNQIKQHNGLTSDTLKIGSPIRIPT